MVVLSDPDPSVTPLPMPPQPIVGSMAKESEPISSVSIKAPEVSLPIADMGIEMDLPKEVSAAGVTQRPVQVVPPQSVLQQGVVPTGGNVTVQNGSSIVLPLTDEKIEEGLKLGVGNSIRWLAEWCVRQLKRMHIGLRRVGTAWVRVRE